MPKHPEYTDGMVRAVDWVWSCAHVTEQLRRCHESVADTAVARLPYEWDRKVYYKTTTNRGKR